MVQNYNPIKHNLKTGQDNVRNTCSHILDNCSRGLQSLKKETQARRTQPSPKLSTREVTQQLGKEGEIEINDSHLAELRKQMKV